MYQYLFSACLVPAYPCSQVLSNYLLLSIWSNASLLKLQAQVEHYNELKQEHSEIVVEYHTLEANHSRCHASQKLFDKDFVDKSTKIKELSISVTQLQKVIEHKNSEIGESLASLDHKQTEWQKALEQVHLRFCCTFTPLI